MPSPEKQVARKIQCHIQNSKRYLKLKAETLPLSETSMAAVNIGGHVWVFRRNYSAVCFIYRDRTLISHVEQKAQWDGCY
jgi:hypothetical protein